MRPELKAAWLAALRSGEFKQGRELLEQDGAYCCLGVLAKLVGAEFLYGEERPVPDEDGGLQRLACYLSYQGKYSTEEHLGDLRFELGVSEWVMEKLIKLNDGSVGLPSTRKNFLEIADWIEAHDLQSSGFEEEPQS